MKVKIIITRRVTAVDYTLNGLKNMLNFDSPLNPQTDLMRSLEDGNVDVDFEVSSVEAVARWFEESFVGDFKIIDLDNGLLVSEELDDDRDVCYHDSSSHKPWVVVAESPVAESPVRDFNSNPIDFATETDSSLKKDLNSVIEGLVDKMLNLSKVTPEVGDLVEVFHTPLCEAENIVDSCSSFEEALTKLKYLTKTDSSSCFGVCYDRVASLDKETGRVSLNIYSSTKMYRVLDNETFTPKVPNTLPILEAITEVKELCSKNNYTELDPFFEAVEKEFANNVS